MWNFVEQQIRRYICVLLCDINRNSYDRLLSVYVEFQYFEYRVRKLKMPFFMNNTPLYLNIGKTIFIRFVQMLSI